jgi:signal transduction histidine kinase/ActR/RegA family two-component response regulator
MTLALPSNTTAQNPRVRQIFDEHYNRICVRCDRMFAVLFVAQWIGGIIAAMVLSPRLWAGSYSQVHPHVWAAIFLGGAIISFPLYLIFTQPGTVMTRQFIAIAQMLASALLIHISGGRIETHFHVFGSLAFLAFYRDWRVLLSATIVVALDHMLRGIFWPESVFGIATASQWRWVEHAAWVIFEDIFLFFSCFQGQREMLDVAQHRERMENTNAGIEATVNQRTAELRASQVELRAAKEAAEAASLAKSQFLANMSHEIRTPMTAILGYADVLLEPQEDPSARLNGLQIIRRNGQHLMMVMNDILDISKIEAGHMSVEKIECDPAKIVAEVSSLMGARSAEKNLPLIIEFDGPIPTTVQSDPTRIGQILMNIVGNAIKFTQHGSVRIIVRLTTSIDDPNPKLQFDVIDTGLGMTPDQIKGLFRPFAQADGSMARKFGGTGLGLAISKRLAQMLGGDITLKSEPQIGSTFSITIATGPLLNVPLIQQPLSISDNINQKSPSQTTPPTLNESTRLAGLRILLAEDGLDNQRLIGHILRTRGADLTIVENGLLAYDAALKAANQQQPYDIILMDMQMPEMDGYTATSKLREMNYRGIIIALTAHAMESDRQKCLNAGCTDYASKPIDRKSLVKMLADYQKQPKNPLAA